MEQLEQLEQLERLVVIAYLPLLFSIRPRLRKSVSPHIDTHESAPAIALEMLDTPALQDLRETLGLTQLNEILTNSHSGTKADSDDCPF